MYSTPIQQSQQQIVYGSNNWGTRIYGVSPDYLTIRDIRIAEGQPFTTEDVRSTNKIALLGKTVVDNIFAGEDPIGKTIRIRKVRASPWSERWCPKGKTPVGRIRTT